MAVIVFGVTGNGEVSAFRLEDLATSVGLSEQDFLVQIKLNEDTLSDALMEAEPLERIDAPKGGTEEQCYYNLLLRYPTGIRAEKLLD